jgi:hypothetical protein
MHKRFSARRFSRATGSTLHEFRTQPAALTGAGKFNRLIYSMESNLSDDSKAVLKVVLAAGSIRGFELEERCNLTPAKLIEATSQLVQHQFITASGAIGPDTVERDRFAPLCSGFQNAPA